MFSSHLTVAFIEDDETLRAANIQSLELAGIDAKPFSSAMEALPSIGPDFAGVVVTDIRMPQFDGLQLSKRLRDLDPELPVILTTGHANIAEAVEAMNDGAYDYIAKPYGPERLIAGVRRALEKRRLVLDNRQLTAAANRVESSGALIGETPAMDRLRCTIAQLAEADVDVLLEGETGVGKGLVARLLHRGGPRRSRPFVTVDCAAFSEAAIELELFGHEPAAVPGAVKRRSGKIEAAERGALFLDEIDSLPCATQAKLLRVLEECEMIPVGGNEGRPVDVRVIAAAEADLGALAEAGAFKRGLFHRLNAVRIRIPPLRERRSDIPLLFASFLADASARFKIPRPPLTDAVRHHLLEHNWPGNVRELYHFAERVVLSVSDEGPTLDSQSGISLPQRVENFEAQLIREALTTNKGDVRSTLEALMIPRKTFYDKLQRHRIDIDLFRPPR